MQRGREKCYQLLLAVIPQRFRRRPWVAPCSGMRDRGTMRKRKENKAFLICSAGISKMHGFPLFLGKVDSELVQLSNNSENRLTCRCSGAWGPYDLEIVDEVRVPADLSPGEYVQ